MRDTTEEEEDRVTSFSDVLMLSEDVLSSGNVGEDSFGFGFTGKDCPQIVKCSVSAEELLSPKPSLPYRDSLASPLSSRNNACTKKRTGSGDGHDRVSEPKPGKRCKRDQKKSSVGNAKVRKEKVGERITALQQLVSPYGKTDTASVLHETMGYIKFLQDQVQVLSSPYLKDDHPRDDEDTGDVKELTSNGLCLVPLGWTVHVSNTNGADLWSPTNILSPTVNQ